MKKIIYLILGIFALYINFENIYLVYAQLDDNFGDEPEIQVEEGKNILDGKSDGDNNLEEINNEEINPEKGDENMNNVDNQDFTSQSDDLQETVTLTDSIETAENIADIQPIVTFDNNNIQVYEVPQVKQNIDTSEYGIIRVADPENPRKGITIHDRNLGATTTGYGATDDKSCYGYYFQWGNNYGFPTTGNIEKVDSNSVDVSGYGPNNPYSSDTFIEGIGGWTSGPNQNLRGGTGDDENNGGYPVTNAVERQGPCPTGYHIPSIGEYGKLVELWNNEYSSMTQSNKPSFLERFNIPIAGFRNPNINMNWNGAFLWSSTPASEFTSKARYLFVNDTPNFKRDPHNYGVPIRCFYNSYWLPVKITYDINGGYWSGDETGVNKMIVTYTKDNDSPDYSGDIILGVAKKSGNYTFGGWFTLTGDELWNGNISGDISLYAKWLPFEDKEVILSGIVLTIMDRNIGAANSGTGEDSYGYYLTGGEENILCPEGYHIPTTGEWLGIKKILEPNFDGDYVRDLLNLPFAGKIENNEITGTGEYGYYLAKDGNKLMYAKIDNSDIEVGDLNEGKKVSVRCFKDYNTGTIKFNSNGGNNFNDMIAVNWWEDGEILGIPTRQNSIFSGWYTTNNFEEGTKIGKSINYKNTEEINLYAKWECEDGYQNNENKCEAIYYDITWIDGNGNILKIDNVRRGDTPIYSGDTPTKKSTSDYNYIFNGMWFPGIVAAFENTGYFAQFNEEPIKRSGGNSSGGGGRKFSISNEHASADSILSGDDKSKGENTSTIYLDNISKGENNIKLTSSSLSENSNFFKPINYSESTIEGKNLYSQEFIDAYNFAYKYGITTTKSIKDAKMYSPLTRIEMAKMLSNFAINVLGKKPDISKGMVKFDDVTNKLNLEYGNAVTIAYQLGIMGQNIKSNRFRPNDEVTRAEFVTALSRMLYGIKDGKGKIKYYEPHISKLYNEGIINKTNPSLKEKKGYVMLILFRVSYHNQFKNN